MFKYFKYIFFTGLLIMLSGCYYDHLVSWSPDGRYVLYASPDNEELRQFDTKTGKTEEIKLALPPSKENLWKTEPLKKELQGCRYLKDQAGILILTGEHDLYLRNMKTGYCELIDTDIGLGFDISGDGKGIYYIKESKNAEKKKYTLMKYRAGNKSTVFSRDDEIVFPCVSPDGDYILFSTEHSLSVYNVVEKKSSVIISSKDGNYYFPEWVSKDEIVYIFVEEKEDKDIADKGVGKLCRLSIDIPNKKADSDPVVLKKNIFTMIPYSITNYTHTVQTIDRGQNPNISKVTEPVVALTVETFDDFYETMIISIKTGDLIWKSDSISSAFSPSLSPDGNSLAYLSDVDDFIYLETQNLTTGKRTMAWRNEEEKLFAEAETLKQAKEFQMALDKYHLITKQYPDTQIQKAAYYNIAMLKLSPEAYDLDGAYESIINPNASASVPPVLWKNLWGPEDLIASDPPEDWIQTYSTDEALKQFCINTDLTRDLRNLWMREGKEWLYIRIDYGSTLDLAGLVFQDTLLLFDYETPDDGSRSISELAEWDKTADIKVLIRHWFESKEKSQYDLEIRNDKDEIIHRYLVSGFSPPDNPFFKYNRFNTGNNNYIVYAISRKILRLNCCVSKINVQACTFKEGIESQRKLETPRFDPSKILCDVADTFGKENTKGRIMADKSKNPENPAVIKGFAGTLELKKQ